MRKHTPAPLTRIPLFPASVAFVAILPDGRVNAGRHNGVEREFDNMPLYLEWAAKRLATSSEAR